jgi:hypothetical protein
MLLQIQYGMFKVCDEYLKGEHELFEFKIPVTILRHDFEVIHVKGKKKKQ